MYFVTLLIGVLDIPLVVFTIFHVSNLIPFNGNLRHNK